MILMNIKCILLSRTNQYEKATYCVCVCVTQSVTSNSLQPMNCNLPGSRFLWPWNSPGKNTGVDYHFLVQGIFPTQESMQVSHIAGRLFTIWATREVPGRSKTTALLSEVKTTVKKSVVAMSLGRLNRQIREDSFRSGKLSDMVMVDTWCFAFVKP